MFIDKPLCHKQAPSERHVVLCFICRSDGAKVLYITFFYKHFTPTGLFFKKLKCYRKTKLLQIMNYSVDLVLYAGFCRRGVSVQTVSVVRLER